MSRAQVDARSNKFPSAVWNLKGYPQISMFKAPGGWIACTQPLDGSQQMIYTQEWLRNSGMHRQQFSSLREAAEVLASMIDAYGPPPSA